MAPASAAAELMKMAEAYASPINLISSSLKDFQRLNKPITVDIDVKIIKGWDFAHSHGVLLSPSYFVEMQLGEIQKQTPASSKKEKSPNWNAIFVFAADLYTRLIIRVYCKHGQSGKGDHVIGETTLNILEAARNKNIDIDVYDPTKGTAKTVRGHLTLYLAVSSPTTFALPNEAYSALDLQAIPQDVIKLLSLEQIQTLKLSLAWRQFLPAFGNVVSRAASLLHLHPCSQIAIAAVAFAVKAVVDQIVRDEKIERLIQIIGDLYVYFLDALSIQKILSYKKTLERLLGQTSECAYFIGNYRQIKLFAQRAVVNIVSGADIMIAQMENAFGELKIELLLGSSLQTVVVSCRILQKVENIENLMYINYLPCSKSASWDSGRVCLPGTRQDIINDVVFWTVTGTPHSQLYVLRGPVGCGKSSIAHTIAETFHQHNRLGAAVFLDGCVDQKVNSQTVASTIAYQLACYDTTIGQRIAEIIKGNPSLASANIERQLPELIGAATQGLEMIGPVIIVVDGLTDHQEQHRLLTAIANSSSYFPANFCFFVTSRYESKPAGSETNWSIRDIGFDDLGDGTLDLDKYTHQCLQQLLSVKPNLFRQYTLEELGKLLIRRAMGMHYWVTTIYRLLLSSCDGNDYSILGKILSSPPPLSNQETMDHVYLAVLHVLRDVSLPVSVNTIFHVLIQSSPLLSQSSNRWSTCLVPQKLTRGPLQILEELDGIIETGHDQQGLPLFRLQPNFTRFIIDPQRCGTTGFHVDRHLPIICSLAELCLDEMNHTLAHNLCQLDDLMLLDEEILDKEDRIRQFIPGTLRYACCQWISHLEPARDVDAVVPKIKTFLFSHLLHWFEVMSILGYFQLIIPSLERLASWFKKHHIPDTRCDVIIMDGIQFIRAFYPIISKASMQVYISALPLMSPDTSLFEVYHTEAIPGRSDLRSLTPSGWAKLNTPERSDANLHLDTNTSFGYLIAKVVSYPTNRVHFYDCRTDNEVGISLPLQSPAKSTHFSPDQRHILTVDDHGTISIWDVEKRSLVVDCIKSDFQQPLIHHSARGNRILVGGREANGFGNKFSVWNTASYKRIRQFKFDISYWHNISLSPDGTKLAVQERNRTSIQFFDVESGELIDKPFGANEEGVVSESLSLTKLIWSSKGDLLAFVSRRDSSIRLWAPDRGTSILLPKSGYNGSHLALSGLEFSPDNSCIAALYSYSKSKSERDRQNSHAWIWDTLTGKIIWSEKLPQGEYTMSFLPDSQEILFIEVELNKPPIRVVRLPAHMSYPPRIYKWTSVSDYIQYSQLTSSTNVDFTSKVDGDGWVINTAGKRQMWVPYPGFELCSEDRTESDGQQANFSQRKTLEVKVPRTDIVVLRFKIDFRLKNE